MTPRQVAKAVRRKGGRLRSIPEGMSGKDVRAAILAGLIRWDGEPGAAWFRGAYVLTEAGQRLVGGVTPSVTDSVTPVTSPDSDRSKPADSGILV